MRAMLILLLLLVQPAWPDDDSDRRNIVGVWKLVSVFYEDAKTKERTPVLGEHPKGRQIATADGHWLALVTADGRKVPQNDEERARALRTMIAYTGRYRVEGQGIVFMPDGGESQRAFFFHDGSGRDDTIQIGSTWYSNSTD